MPNPIVLAISGPPRAGKDTTCDIISELVDDSVKIRTARMSAPLKAIAREFLVDKRMSYEENKDREFVLGPPPRKGTTYRELQIEAYYFGARLLGSDWLGHHYTAMLKKYWATDLILMPDAGRPEEVQVVIDAGYDVRQVKLERPDTTYQGDSRIDFTIKPCWWIENNGSKNKLRFAISLMLEAFVPQVPASRVKPSPGVDKVK